MFGIEVIRKKKSFWWEIHKAALKIHLSEHENKL